MGEEMGVPLEMKIFFLFLSPNLDAKIEKWGAIGDEKFSPNPFLSQVPPHWHLIPIG